MEGLDSARVRTISFFVARFRNLPNHPARPLTAPECAVLDGILDQISSIPKITRKIERDLNLRKVLQLVVGTYNLVDWDYAFPDPLPAKAAAILANFEAMNWSATGADEPEPAATNAVAVNSVRRPPATNAYYSPTGPMRGILFREHNTFRYVCDPQFQRRSADVRGHNGHTVGDWWPLQICAYRDGAHGVMQGGIHGARESGAFSVVVSGMYNQYDQDEGHALWYSGTMAHNSLSATNPIISDKSQAMITAQSRGRELRVLRSANSRSSWSPEVGIRYDGLYRITARDIGTNEHGGTFPRFRLQRVAGQPAIDQQVPSAVQRLQWRKAKEGY